MIMLSGMSGQTDSDLRALRDKLQTVEDFWAQTKPLNSGDFVLIGRFIQIYAYSILNCRRILSLIQRHSRPKRKLTANSMPDSHTFEQVRDAANEFPDCDLKKSLIAACDILMMHASIRHHFAHWGVRRARKRNVYVIIGAKEQEVGKHAGFDLEPDHIAFGIFPIPHLRDELRKLADHGQNLAEIASKIDEMRADLPRFLAEGRNRQRSSRETD